MNLRERIKAIVAWARYEAPDFESVEYELRRALEETKDETLPDGVYPQPNVTRVEVIDADDGGRCYGKWGADVKLSYQDDGRTLKVFVDRRLL